MIHLTITVSFSSQLPSGINFLCLQQHIALSLHRAEFKEIRLLGTGNFSKVYLAQHRLDGVNYAIKRSAHHVCSDATKRQWVQVSHADASIKAC